MTRPRTSRPTALGRGALGVTCLLGACVIPPSQSTLGAIVTTDRVGTRASLGVHTSALDHRGAVPVDLGAGWIGESVDGRDTAHATYIAATRRVSGPLWLGGRAELFWSVADDQPRRALMLRAALRRHLASLRWSSGDGRGALGVLGALATGAYLDVGARALASGGAEVVAAAGVSLDLPALAGVSK